MSGVGLRYDKEVDLSLRWTTPEVSEDKRRLSKLGEHLNQVLKRRCLSA